MRIAVFGANGAIGSAIVSEALSRSHRVTAAVRSPTKITYVHANLTVVEAHISSASSVEKAVRGHDAVVDAVGGLGHDNPRISIECIEPLISGMLAAGVYRLLVVGTAGTLRLADSGLRMDQPDFPEVLKVEAQAQSEVLHCLRTSAPTLLRWTYFSPPALIEEGERTGRIRLGQDRLMFDGSGRSFISNQDFAIAALDELEVPQHERRRFTAISYSGV